MSRSRVSVDTTLKQIETPRLTFNTNLNTHSNGWSIGVNRQDSLNFISWNLIVDKFFLQQLMKSFTRIAKRRTRKGQKEKNRVNLPQLTSPLEIKSKPFQMSLTMSLVNRATLKMKNMERSWMRSIRVLTGSSWMPENNCNMFLELIFCFFEWRSKRLISYRKKPNLNLFNLFKNTYISYSPGIYVLHPLLLRPL